MAVESVAQSHIQDLGFSIPLFYLPLWVNCSSLQPVWHHCSAVAAVLEGRRS